MCEFNHLNIGKVVIEGVEVTCNRCRKQITFDSLECRYEGHTPINEMGWYDVFQDFPENTQCPYCKQEVRVIVMPCNNGYLDLTEHYKLDLPQTGVINDDKLIKIK